MKQLHWTIKRLPVLFFVLLGLHLTALSAFAATPQVKVESRAADIVFDGKRLAIPQGQYIFMINGTNYVPIRFISYALQKNVGWDPKTKTVTVQEPNKQEQAMLKEYLINAVAKDGQLSAEGGKKLSVAPVQAKFVFEGKTVQLPKGLSGYMLNNSIYVPIRFMSESVGTEIKWDGKTGKITAETPAYKKQQDQAQTDTGTETGTDGGGAIGGSPGGPGPGSGSDNTSYASITANAEKQLNALKDGCYGSLMDLGMKYLASSDEQEKKQLLAQGDAKLTECTNSFNQIIAKTEQQLTANGHSTAILADYRKAFEDEIKAGRELMKGM